MKLQEDKLRAKGWSEEEITNAKNILEKAEEKKHPQIKFWEEFIEWIVLLLVIIASVAGAWLIEPLLLVLNQQGALIAIGISGILFGTFSSIIIEQIEEIEKHHHLIISLTIPLAAIITSIIITQRVQIIIEAANLSISHNPYLLGLVYTICSLLPYAIFVYKQRKEHGTL